MSADLVVLGAGPAGLAAAWRASRAGMSTLVLERAELVGGMAGSFTVAGTRVDFGSHRLHPSIDPRILDDLTGLLGDDLQLRRRDGRLRVAGQWVGFPLRPAELVRGLPAPMLARVAAESLTSPLRRILRRRHHDSYEAALRSGLGPTLYDQLYRPFAIKLWGMPGHQIDLEQARRRVSADTPWKIAVRTLRPARRSGQGRWFRYPARGFGQTCEALAEAATTAGADVRLRTEAASLVVDDDSVTVTTSTGDDIEARQVFSTVPLPVLARIVSPGPAPDVVAAASRLRFRAMVLVYVVHAGRPWTPYDAHYVPDLSTPVTRISEPANYRDSPTDPADTTVLCAEIPCDADDPDPDGGLWTASDDTLAAVIRETARRFGLPTIKVLGVHVRRLRRVYPVYEIGYRRHLAGLEAWADALPRVTTFGRLGTFAHDNSHHAMAMAYDAVDALRADGTLDPDAWAAARRRFTDHVVED